MTEKERFPGERESDTAMPSQPGIIGTTGYGGDLPATNEDATVNEDMAREKANEGGGHRPMADDRKRTISGPGASDFIASEGGEDLPGTSLTKGMGATRDQNDVTDRKNLEPRTAPDTDDETPPKA